MSDAVRGTAGPTHALAAIRAVPGNALVPVTRQGAPEERSVAEPSNGRAAELRKASHALEGVFVNELFKAMRATVPQGGFLSEDPGHDLFTGMLDERLAQIYAERAQNGLGEALYRQLSRRLTDAGPDQGAS